MHFLLLEIGGFEGDVVQEGFHDGMEAAGSDVLHLLIHLSGKAGYLGDGILFKHQPNILRLQKGDILFDQGILRFLQYADEILLGKRFQLHPYRKAALQLGDQIGGLGDMKGPGGDEQDMIGAYHAVLGIHRSALHDRQQVALYALPADIRSLSPFPAGDLVQLVQEDDPALLHPLDGNPGDEVHIDQFLLLFLHQVFHGLGDLHFAFLLFSADHVGNHVLDVDRHLLETGPLDELKGKRYRAFLIIDLHDAVVQFPFAQLPAQFFPGLLELFLRSGFSLLGRQEVRLEFGRRQQQIQDTFLRIQLGLFFDFQDLLIAYHVDGYLHQVANHRFHITSYIPYLRKLGGFHLDEGGVGQAGESPGDLRLADPGRSDHDDVLRGDLIGDLRGEFLAPHTIPQSDRHGTFGRHLPDNILIQLGHDLFGGQFVETFIFVGHAWNVINHNLEFLDQDGFIGKDA